jgi:hypothetical protein
MVELSLAGVNRLMRGGALPAGNLADLEPLRYSIDMLVRGFTRALARMGVLLCATAAVASCTLPGTTLGTYNVSGALESDTCGGAPNPWTFDVMLSRKGTTLYWSWLDASPILSGPISSEGRAALTGYQLHNVDSTEAGMGPCDLQRDDDLELVLGTDSTPASFEGTISYAFSVQEGADCSDQLTTSGGMYERLPCTVTYTVAAKRQ